MIGFEWRPSSVLLGGRLGRRSGHSRRLRGSPRSRRGTCCSSSPHTRRPSRRRVVSAFLYYNRNHCLPQPLRMGSSVNALRAPHLLVFHRQAGAPTRAAATVAQSVPLRSRPGSRKHPHPHPPPQPPRLWAPGVEVWRPAAARERLPSSGQTRPSAAVPSVALDATRGDSGPSAVKYSQCSTSSSSGGARDGDVTCRT